MDFMKLLQSLEQALFEVISWLVFYPITLWQAIRHPFAMMEYADGELVKPADDRFTSRLSPPIFLAITLGLLHLIEVQTEGVEMHGFLADNTNLMAFRMFVLSVLPLGIAVRFMQFQNLRFDRKVLRPLFYGQIYISAPIAMAVGIATAILPRFVERSYLGNLFGIAIVLIGGLWYIALEIVWFQRHGPMSYTRALAYTAWATFVSLILIIGLSAAVSKL
ncbi:hypothetical protein EB810_04770 [Altererythrobacter sp. FM1]|uniref:Permease n=1 Tax=Tsuneonella flava TaxID=2055955 RepID=A0ABX7KBG4_9SPHN|nr:hypothetical protein [Tsuneonella flava]QSB45623.1 hypothetical protein IDJ81_05815 [Tsuneonella flava]ROT97217.1 hypothetical protein EB810_04770 [Altererythrobacter sp. FM1]